MATEPRSRRRRRKKILCQSDGSLYDVSERRRISPSELRDHVRDGGLFEARRQESGRDCTYEVLQEVIGRGLLQSFVPGLGGGLPGLGGLAGLAGGGGALGALGSLGGLVKALGDRANDRGWEDWDEAPRRSRRRPSDGPGRADSQGRANSGSAGGDWAGGDSADGDWADGDWADGDWAGSPGRADGDGADGDWCDKPRRPPRHDPGDWAGDPAPDPD
jgi:hypothetical protein